MGSRIQACIKKAPPDVHREAQLEGNGPPLPCQEQEQSGGLLEGFSKSGSPFFRIIPMPPL
ncbi:MAG: hypothetical protein P8X79_07225 [Reinekea sp.]